MGVGCGVWGCLASTGSEAWTRVLTLPVRLSTAAAARGTRMGGRILVSHSDSRRGVTSTRAGARGTTGPAGLGGPCAGRPVLPGADGPEATCHLPASLWCRLGGPRLLC